MDDDRLARTMAAIDAVHAQDPEMTSIEGVATPSELVYAQHMSAWLERLAPDAPVALRLACRCQHLRRWQLARHSYPMDRAGYHQWRTDLARLAGDEAAQIVGETGYDASTADRVAALVRKENLRSDTEAQALEDAACLVFIEHHLADFAKEHDEDKLLRIIRKTWRKMSPSAHAMAMDLELPDDVGGVIAKAIGV